jgi:hypothetical protein
MGTAVHSPGLRQQKRESNHTPPSICPHAVVFLHCVLPGHKSKFSFVVPVDLLSLYLSVYMHFETLLLYLWSVAFNWLWQWIVLTVEERNSKSFVCLPSRCLGWGQPEIADHPQITVML